jgi:hypothetical protein
VLAWTREMNPLTLIKKATKKASDGGTDAAVERMAKDLPKAHAESLRRADRYSVEHDKPGDPAPSYL